jgi:Fic family protein
MTGNVPAHGYAWPALEFEAVVWERGDTKYASRRQLRQAAGKYQAAIPLEIATRDFNLPSELLAAAEDATSALVRFDSEVGHIPTPFAAILLRTESASSSEIERLTVSAKQLALAELGNTKTPNSALVLANVRAMEAALEFAQHLDANSIVAMQRALLGEPEDTQKHGWRNEQVWIGGGISPHTAEFVPPVHGRIQHFIDDLMRFIDRDDLPVLAQIAIAHAQFETIHPFVDGNGRTGRALVQSLLRAKGVTVSTTVPLSAGLLNEAAQYVEALTAYRLGNLEPIVAEFANSAFRAVENGSWLRKELSRIEEKWKSQAVGRTGSVASKLGTYLLRQPVVSIASIVTEFSVTAPVALQAVRKFEAIGALEQTNQNKRNRTWQAPQVLKAMEEFAARARRARQ